MPKLVDLISLNNMAENSGQEIEILSDQGIAIIGIAVKLPSAQNTGQFWNNIKNNAVYDMNFPPGRKKDAGDFFRFKNRPVAAELKYAQIAYLDEIDKFDYPFFNLSPKESSLIDPNQRIFLETAWQAIEDAGYGGEALLGSRTGVYIGFRSDDFYTYRNLILEVEPDLATTAFIPNLTSIMAGRISYLLDFKGPSMVIDTACSASLVAVHLACRAIKSGECEMALAGGIRINILPVAVKDKLGIESSDGKARAFDNESDGTGLGEGAIAILLKPLNKALRDRDHVYAVIKGSAVNQDGISVGLTAPNVLSQEDVIVRAWKDAGVDPETIAYVEAHGTGTPLGDPIEVDGIQRAFQRYTDKKQFCAISSVKTNLGHLDNVAGIAGLLQAVLALKNKQLPPNNSFNKPNRKINFEESPVYVNDQLSNWESEGFPRRCGVSSFGLSGTNCHLILEEAPETRQEDGIQSTSLILILSAKSEESFKRLIQSYDQWLMKESDYRLEDLCFTANTGRGHYQYRMAIIFKDAADLKSKINSLNSLEEFPVINQDGIYYGHREKMGEYEQLTDRREVFQRETQKLNQQADLAIEEFIHTGKTNEALLNVIAGLYIQGAKVKWDQLYGGENRRRIAIPVYPFAKHRCWLRIPETIPAAEEPLYYQTKWKLSPLISGAINQNQGAILIFEDKRGIGRQIAQIFQKEGREVIQVVPGAEFTAVQPGIYTITGNPSDYQNLLQHLKGKKVTQIVHLSALDNETVNSCRELEENQRTGVLSLFHLTQALIAANAEAELEIDLIAELTHEVTGQESSLKPENATLFGLGKVIGIEYPSLKCRGIDIDENLNIGLIVRELSARVKERQIAYRNGSRYIAELGTLDLTRIENRIVPVRDDGLYIITGGTGGIGLEVARFLASQKKIKLALLSRSGMPSREQWDSIVGGKSNEKLRHKIRMIQEIEKNGSLVICYSVDVADETAMKSVFNHLREQYGIINGIIHGAGIAGDSLIINQDEQAFNQVLSPKVKGTWILDQLTHNDPLDFFILFSSFIAWTGGPGQGSYTAANNYLDSFAAYRDKNGRKTMAIHWATWKETGMAVDYGVNQDSIFKTLNTALALEAFQTVFQKNLNQVLIGAINDVYELFNDPSVMHGMGLAPELMERVFYQRKAKGCPVFETGGRFTPVKLSGRENRVYSESEQQIGGIWGEILGLAEIDIERSFYELGGNSLLAIRIINQLNQLNKHPLEVADLLKNSTIAALAAYLEVKTATNRESNLPAIEPVPENEYYPVSSAQKRMFILNQLKGQSISDNISRALIIEGPIDRERFEKSMAVLIGRHETLRTSFELLDMEPIQRIHREVHFSIDFCKASGADETELTGMIDRFIQPFDLKEAPLFRIKLVELSATQHLLIYDLHHIISDGTSVNILINEFMKLYQGLDLPGLKIQYKDFAVWQNKLLHSEMMKQQEKYWLNVFSGKLPVLNLSTDFPRLDVQTYEGDSLEFEMDEVLTGRLNKLASDNNVTLYMVLLAAYYILLAKYSGQGDIVIGVPVSGRRYSELENIIGMFVNTLPMRNYPRRDIKFLDFLREIKSCFLETYQNEDYPLDELVHKLGIPRDSSRNPLFDTMFELQNIENSNRTIDELTFTPFNHNPGVTQFDIIIHVRAGNRLYFQMLYGSNLYKEETMARFARHFVNIAMEITDNPEFKISQIKMLSDIESEALKKINNSQLDNVTIDFNF